MHRSSSTSRAYEEYVAQFSSPSQSSKASQGVRTSETNELLPTYDPMSDVARKEKSRIKFAENAVHFIPVVLVLCAIILWFFSNPAVDMVNKDDSILARIKGLTIDGNIDNDSAQTGLLTTLDLEDLDSAARMPDRNTGKFLRMRI